MGSPEIERTLERLVERLHGAAGANLLGVAAYGSLVKGRFTPGISDVNVLVVVADAGFSSLLPLAPALTAARREAAVVPFVATPEDLRRSAALFPVKILDLQTSHRLLWGDVHLAGIAVAPEALRLRALQELQNLELRLRQRVVERNADPETLWRGLVRSLPQTAVTLETLLRARGVTVPADRPSLLRLAAAELGVSDLGRERMDRLADLHRHEGRPSDEDDETVYRHYAEYLDLLAEIVRRVQGEAGPGETG